jgi:hypothetical protein
MKYHYAIAGLQEPERINVMSMEQPTAVGNYLKVDGASRRYRVWWCKGPLPTERDAAYAALDGQFTLRVALEGN